MHRNKYFRNAVSKLCAPSETLLCFLKCPDIVSDAQLTFIFAANSYKIFRVLLAAFPLVEKP